MWRPDWSVDIVGYQASRPEGRLSARKQKHYPQPKQRQPSRSGSDMRDDRSCSALVDQYWMGTVRVIYLADSGIQCDALRKCKTGGLLDIPAILIVSNRLAYGIDGLCHDRTAILVLVGRLAVDPTHRDAFPLRFASCRCLGQLACRRTDVSVLFVFCHSAPGSSPVRRWRCLFSPHTSWEALRAPRFHALRACSLGTRHRAQAPA